MFQLRPDEYEALRSQIVTLKLGRGQHRRYLPFVFTEQGVAMLATVLNSETALQGPLAQFLKQRSKYLLYQ
ncbi:MAG: ORF6N domain-containing protein [Nitrospirae bacterium]|nr:ORF6N domain-containing protein [Nitrospirota bacterium]